MSAASKPRRAALYLRVSSDSQTVENQIGDLEQLAASRGLVIVERYDEIGSAAKKRPKFDALMRDAQRRHFDVLVVWSLDRFGRSMAGNVAAVVELDRIGVEVLSVREPWLDTGGPVRSLLVAVLSWVAEFERARLIERTRAGLARARREGKRLGRPRVVIDVPRARRLRGEGRSIRDVARVLGVSRSVLGRALGTAVPESPSASAANPAEIEGSS